MNDLKEGCGCFIASFFIVGVAWILMTISGGGSSNYSAPTNPSYTNPDPIPTHSSPATIKSYSSEPITSEPTYSTPGRSETPDDAYDNGYDEGHEHGLEDGRNGRSHGYGYDDSSDYYNYYETRYQEGYEEGYNEGYEEGKRQYEEKIRLTNF